MLGASSNEDATVQSRGIAVRTTNVPQLADHLVREASTVGTVGMSMEVRLMRKRTRLKAASASVFEQAAIRLQCVWPTLSEQSIQHRGSLSAGSSTSFRDLKASSGRFSSRARRVGPALRPGLLAWLVGISDARPRGVEAEFGAPQPSSTRTRTSASRCSSRIRPRPSPGPHRSGVARQSSPRRSPATISTARARNGSGGCQPGSRRFDAPRG
jgi:hypothetical protein